jgi:hypothetical protein
MTGASRLLVLLFLLAGCSTMKIDDFAGTEPPFVPEEYFLGTTRAWGFFQDRFGRIRREFVVDIEGSLDGETLVLDERFVYADGERQTRVWRIRRLADGSYAGEADDVIGTATGQVQGRAMNWRYDFDLPIGERSFRVHFDDWMLLQDGEVMLNRTTISKFGITLGEVVIFFRRLNGPISALEGEATTHPLQQAAE